MSVFHQQNRLEFYLSQRLITSVAWLALLAVSAFSFGCQRGDGIERVKVTGNVSFEGQPVANGEIRFVPEVGPLSGAPIVDGRYEIHHKGGVPVGKHAVRITAFNQDQSSINSDLDAPANVKSKGEFQIIPDQYNKNTNLVAEISAAENPKTMDFDLTK